MLRSATLQPTHGGLLYYVVHGREIGTESGRDNPFRPGGDISKEADQIVEAIKSGRPLLTPDTTDTPTAPTPTTDAQIIPTQAPTSLQAQSPPESPISKGGNAGVNGSTPAEAPQSNSGTVEVKHVTVTPSDQGHVERVVIKKKNKCSCCVIQ